MSDSNQQKNQLIKQSKSDEEAMNTNLSVSTTDKNVSQTPNDNSKKALSTKKTIDSLGENKGVDPTNTDEAMNTNLASVSTIARKNASSTNTVNNSRRQKASASGTKQKSSSNTRTVNQNQYNKRQKTLANKQGLLNDPQKAFANEQSLLYDQRNALANKQGLLYDPRIAFANEQGFIDDPRNALAIQKKDSSNARTIHPHNRQRDQKIDNTFYPYTSSSASSLDNYNRISVHHAIGPDNRALVDYSKIPSSSEDRPTPGRNRSFFRIGTKSQKQKAVQNHKYERGDFVVYENQGKKRLGLIEILSYRVHDEPNYMVEYVDLDAKNNVIPETPRSDYIHESQITSEAVLSQKNAFVNVRTPLVKKELDKGDFVEFIMTREVGDIVDEYRCVGYITEITETTYKVNAGELVGGKLQNIKEYEIEQKNVFEWKASQYEKNMFLLKSTATNVFNGITVIKIGYFFLRLAGLLYKFTSDTKFVLLRSSDTDDKKEFIQALSNHPHDGEMQLKHVIQIRKVCPQYWKKIKREFGNSEETVKAKYLDVKKFYDLFFNVRMKRADEEDEDDKFTYFIAICELVDKTM